MSKPDDYLWDRSGPADPDVARLETLLAPLAHDRPLDALKLRKAKKPSRAPWIAAGVAIVAAAAVLVLVLRPAAREQVACATGEGYAFTTGGSPAMCGGGTAARGVLPVGGTLDTGAGTARIEIADIGSAELGPGTKIRLDRSERGKREQLHMERGRMHAYVTAPPRLFAVTTPSTSVVDLGCEYTIEIDEKGVGWIEVQSGKVELETSANALIIAPAGTTARMRAGRQPSVPVVTGARAQLVAAVRAYEDGAPDGVPQILRAAGPEDAITLVNLAVLVPDRTAVLERLAALSPPESVTLALALEDPSAFEIWRDRIVLARMVETLETGGTPKKR